MVEQGLQRIPRRRRFASARALPGSAPQRQRVTARVSRLLATPGMEGIARRNVAVATLGKARGRGERFRVQAMAALAYPEHAPIPCIGARARLALSLPFHGKGPED